MKRLWLVGSMVAVVTPCLAQEGAVPIRIPVADGQSVRCINGKNDKVWLTLRRLVTTRKKGWFTKDNSVVAIINATVKAEPQSPKAIAFPLLTEGTFGDASVGQVSVPLEYTIVSGLSLRQSTVMYMGLGVEITLLNRRGRNGWGNALAALGEIARKVPIPASPITQSASYLMDFANAAISKDIEGQDIDDKVKSAALALNFDPSGQCSSSGPTGSDFETTGTLAILQTEGARGADYVDIGRTNDYCWSAELRPAFILKAAHKTAGAPCSDPRYAQLYRQVTNNYVGFFLNAIRETGVSGAEPGIFGPGASTDRTRSVARCLANGVAQSECLK